MIHGMWGGGWYWENYKTFLEEKGYQCITPTLPYHDMDPAAEPDPALGTMSLLDYAQYLEGVISELDSPPIVIGHSMGGLLAQILASRGLAKALVLLTPASPRGVLALKPSVIWSFISVMIKWGFWKKPMRLSFGKAVYSMLHLLSPEEQKKTYESFVYESGRAAFEIGFWLLDSKRASAVDESKVTCPVLVIASKEDRITPASVVRNVAKKYQSACTYKEMPNNAHWVIGEPGWEQIVGYVAEWLKTEGS
jgi:pimeloyl-ACP methyl ester carboxylesterase